MTKEDRQAKINRANELQAMLVDAKSDYELADSADEMYELSCFIDDTQAELDEIYEELDAEDDSETL